MNRIQTPFFNCFLILVGSVSVYAQERTEAPPGGRQRPTEVPSARRAETEPVRRTEATPTPGRSSVPLVSGAVDETPVVTHHKLNVGDKTLEYTATVAQMPLKDLSGETEAYICYYAYTADNVDAINPPLSSPSTAARAPP